MKKYEPFKMEILRADEMEILCGDVVRVSSPLQRGEFDDDADIFSEN